MAEQENKPDEPTSAPVAETETPKQSGWGGWFSSASVINTGWSVVNNLSSTIKETTKELFGNFMQIYKITNLRRYTSTNFTA